MKISASDDALQWDFSDAEFAQIETVAERRSRERKTMNRYTIFIVFTIILLIITMLISALSTKTRMDVYTQYIQKAVDNE